MQIHFVSFVGLAPGAEKLAKKFGQITQIKERQKALNSSALMFGGVDHVHVYNREKLVTTDYYKDNKRLLDQPRGCGYWAWKPFIILQILNKANDGDYVVYCDVGKPIDSAKNDHGNLITTSLKPLVEWAERNNGMMPGVYLSNHGPSKHWIKRDCYTLMNCDTPRYHDLPTVQAGYTVWKKSPFVIDFLEQWKLLNLDPRLIGDQDNTLGKPNYDGFNRSCHDQATLTLLTEKSGVKVFGDRRSQFLGFRNINFIAHEASFQNAKLDNKLVLNSLNRQCKVVTGYFIRWIELLFQYRRFNELSVAIVVENLNEQQKVVWKNYFPKSEIEITRLDQLTRVSKKFDFILAAELNEHDFTNSLLLNLYHALKSDGVFITAPLLKNSDFEVSARKVSIDGVFQGLVSSTKLEPLVSPKISNSRNPIFVSGKGNDGALESMCLMIKPTMINQKMSKQTNQKTAMEKSRPAGLPPLPKVSQIALLVDDENYSQVDLYVQLIIRVLPKDPYANVALAWVANKFGFNEYQQYYLKVAEQAAQFFSTDIDAIAADLRIDLSLMGKEAIDSEARGLALNQDRQNYHIAKAWGFGFGAEMSALMGQAYLAEMCGRKLVVHWGRNFLYRPEPGSECVFDCYFERFNDLTAGVVIDQAESIYPPKWSKETIDKENLGKREGQYSKLSALYFINRDEQVTVSDYYAGVVNVQPWIKNNGCELSDLSTDDAYRYLAKKYLVPKADIQKEVDSFVNEYLAKPFVAVHARGSDKDEGYRALTSIPGKILDCARQRLAMMPEDTRLFLMTDDMALLDVYKSEFGDRLVLTDCQRCDSDVGVHYDESTNKLQAGKEMLIDMLVAARASCFIGLGLSNPSQLITYFGDFSTDNYILFGENRLKQLNTHLYKTIPVR